MQIVLVVIGFMVMGIGAAGTCENLWHWRSLSLSKSFAYFLLILAGFVVAMTGTLV